ncbi:MAG: dihydrodipicolinate synthase family protein [Betaproteobacteria bacterium]
MTTLTPGFVHTPVTPFKADHAIDFDAYGGLIDFHMRHGAEALAVAMHCGESVSLSDAEQRKLLQFALDKAGGRVPVMAHVSDSGTGMAVARARHAQDIGVAAIVATTPYYWTPPPAMVLEHFAGIGAAVRIPFFILYSPAEMPGTKIGTELVLKLISRVENFAGVVDASLDWQFMVNIAWSAQQARPDFQMLSGTEYMVSAGALGATSMFSALAGVAPRLVRRLYHRCRKEQYFEARPDQEAVSALRQIVKQGGFAGLKAAMRIMGRDCGVPRPPNAALSAAAEAQLAAELQAFAPLRDEPRGG